MVWFTDEDLQEMSDYYEKTLTDAEKSRMAIAAGALFRILYAHESAWLGWAD